MNTQPLHLVSALDRNYVVPYAVMLLSTRRNNSQENLAATVLHYDLIDEDIEFLNGLSNKLAIPITYTKIPRFPFALFRTRSRLSLSTQKTMSPIAYAKAFLDRFLPVHIEKLICIDADAVVVSSISEAKVLQNQEKPIAAVANIPRDHHHQFNSGFMIIDLQKWREIGVSSIAEQFLLRYSNSLHTHDQQTLNLIFRDNWQKIDLKWNYMEDFYRLKERSKAYTLQEIEAAREDPIVIHYAVSSDKPWKANCRHPREGLYQSYRDELLPLMAELSLMDPQEAIPE